MGKTRKSNGCYWENHAAVVPVRFDFVPEGTGTSGSGVVVNAEPPILMKGANAAGQRRCYEILLELPWFSPGVRRAILKELGRSPRTEKAAIERARTFTLRHIVDEAATRMRASGERPRGGVRQAAITAVADNIGMDAETLELRFKRLKRR
jgi:hypothetical protein